MSDELMPCFSCRGTGKSRIIPTVNCYGCKGTGYISKERHEQLTEFLADIKKKIKEDYPQILEELYERFPRLENINETI